jgi:hypothetical protein
VPTLRVRLARAPTTPSVDRGTDPMTTLLFGVLQHPMASPLTNESRPTTAMGVEPCRSERPAAVTSDVPSPSSMNGRSP